MSQSCVEWQFVSAERAVCRSLKVPLFTGDITNILWTLIQRTKMRHPTHGTKAGTLLLRAVREDFPVSLVRVVQVHINISCNTVTQHAPTQDTETSYLVQEECRLCIQITLLDTPAQSNAALT